jgi:hypothetical protein
MITRFAILPDDRRLLLGVDKAELFEAGYVYEAHKILDEIVIKKVGKYSLPKEGHPSELSDVNAQVYSALHLITKEELQKMDDYE